MQSNDPIIPYSDGECCRDCGSQFYPCGCCDDPEPQEFDEYPDDGEDDIDEWGDPLSEGYPEDLTPEGIQLVIPGCEQVQPASVKQGELF